MINQPHSATGKPAASDLMAGEAAALLGCTPARVRAMCGAGELPGAAYDPRLQRWLIPLAGVHAAIAARPKQHIGRPRGSKNKRRKKTTAKSR